MLRWITPGGAIRTRWLSSNSLQVESRRERFVHSTPNKCPLRGLAWEGRGGVTRLAISGAREHVNRKPTRARLACPQKIHHPDARQAAALFLIAPMIAVRSEEHTSELQS